MPCPERLVGMNQELMVQYVKYTADILLSDLHVAPYYKVQNPFPVYGSDLYRFQDEFL